MNHGDDWNGPMPEKWPYPKTTFTPLVSSCHGATLVLMGGNEGTNFYHYQCSKCGEACNAASPKPVDSAGLRVCGCSCHENKLRKPYAHDRACCTAMNGYLELDREPAAPEGWKGRFDKKFRFKFDICERGDRIEVNGVWLFIKDFVAAEIAEARREGADAERKDLIDIFQEHKMNPANAVMDSAADAFNAGLNRAISIVKKRIERPETEQK